MILGVRWGEAWSSFCRSRKIVPEELVTLMSWDPTDFLICLVIVGWTYM